MQSAERIIKVGDTITMIGEMLNGYDKAWTFEVAEVRYDLMDEECDSGPYMRMTTGHTFSSDSLWTRRGQRRGHYFSALLIQ